MKEPFIPMIGSPVPRVDAAAKVTGEEMFAADHYGKEILWAGVRRAGVPHGLIRQVDTADARALSGVVAVLTGADVPGSNRQGIVHKDQPVLCTDKVRHCGDAVALAIASDRKTLERALSLIKVDIEPLQGVFGIDDALAATGPIVHEGRPGGNILLQAEIRKGDIGEGFRSCDVVVEGTFSVPFASHAFLETENGVAWQEPDGLIRLVVSTQAPFRDRWEISHALGIPIERLHVIGPYMGGAFGGKDGATVQCLLALAAMHAGGRRVKMWWSREESMIAGYKRHAALMKYRLGARVDGSLRAIHCRLYYDTGAYAHLGGEVLALGMEHAAGPYRIPDTLIEGWCLYTNNPVAGAMRGFGVAQVSFSFEGMMDRLAGRLGIDPLELRLKNAVRQGDRNASGVELTGSTGIVECLERLRQHPLWREKEAWRAAAGSFKRRGVGIAAVFNAMGYGRGLPDSAIAKIEISPEGKILLYCGVSDMGQGNATAFFQIAGEILRQENGSIEIIQPDTGRTLPSGSASAGRTTYTYGNALVRACEELRRRLLGRAALLLLVDTLDDLELLPGRVRHPATGRDVPLSFIASTMTEPERICISQFLMPVARDVPDTGKGFVIGFPHLFYSHAAHAAFVEVDELTGMVDVKTYIAVTEAGRVINPQGFEQQVQGAVAQGIGYALHEEVCLEKGRILNPDLATYIIPAAPDICEIISVAVEMEEPTGPFGLKGVGEVGINGPLPAISGALAMACGVEGFCSSPLTAEKVLEALGPNDADAAGTKGGFRGDHVGAASQKEKSKGKKRETQLHLPEGLDDLLSCMESYPEALLFAGGTDLFVKLRMLRREAPVLIGLERVGELRGVRETASGLWIGAGTTHRRLLEDERIHRHCPVLAQALRSLGSPQIRNMGTIGGNICTASPAGDTLPPLYLFGAQIELMSKTRTRVIPIDSFIIGPGKTALEPGEIMTGIRLKKREGYGIHHYEKVGQRRALACAVASMAAMVKISAEGVVEKARLAWGSVGPAVVISTEAEAELTGGRLSIAELKRAAARIRGAVSPIDDLRASAEYRRLVSGNLLMRLIDPGIKKE